MLFRAQEATGRLGSKPSATPNQPPAMDQLLRLPSEKSKGLPNWRQGSSDVKTPSSPLNITPPKGNALQIAKKAMNMPGEEGHGQVFRAPEPQDEVQVVLAGLKHIGGAQEEPNWCKSLGLLIRTSAWNNKTRICEGDSLSVSMSWPYGRIIPWHYDS